jgi:amidase/aspartyl-tRNA(Asn)/glutamyl-tRNA(Gln) amidotransferase subunit A
MSNLHDELAYLGIAELAGLYRKRQLSPVEVVDAALARIKQRNPAINAVVFLDEDYARAEARKAEQALAAAGDASPLLGIPTAIKDLADSRPGWRGTFGGIRCLKDNVIDTYCHFAASMERAGAIALGKTNSPTFGFRGTCDNYLFGPTRNPFDLSRNSGGSSGGAAAAVAGGLLPFAEATDGGGSIRIPAAWNNLFGFKGTSGSLPRLSRPQAFSATTLFTFEGCVTRSVEDSALVLEAMSGHDSRDPFSLPGSVDWLGALRGSIKGWKVAYSPDLGAFPIDAGVRALVDEAVRAFADAGAAIEEVKLEMPVPALELGDLWCRLFAPNTVTQVDRLRRAGTDLLGEHRADLPPEIHHWLELGQRYSVLDLARDQELRTRIYDAIEDVFEDYDLLVTPTLACPPVENGGDGNTLGPLEINGVALNRLIGWCLTFPFNFTGHPAASAPAGLVAGIWPAGLQFVGRKYADAAVISAGAAFEQARPWKQHYRLCNERQQ